jgi:DNA-binding PadR family transcriptional regulator
MKNANSLCNHFGSYAQAIETAVGFNPQKVVLRTLEQLTSTTAYASLTEVSSDLKRWGYQMSDAQIRGLLGLFSRQGIVDVRHGDRIRLFRLTPEGRRLVKTHEELRVALRKK